MAKILLFCPTYEVNGSLHIWPDSEASFWRLRTPAGVKTMRMIGQDNPYPGGKHRNTLHQYQQAQRKALDEGFDGLCTFEDDMIVPEDGLIKLWDTPADVVYGVYQLRHGAYVLNAFRTMGESPNIGESLSFYDDEYQAALQAGSAIVSGCGMGFTLIRRHVLERFPLRDWQGSYAPDWALAHDCQAAGIKQMARFDVQCGHIEDDGRVLWPGRKARNMKIEALVSFVGDIGNGNQAFQAGEILDGDPRRAWEYVRAGFMKSLEPDAMAEDPAGLIETATLKIAEKAVSPRGKKRP